MIDKLKQSKQAGSFSISPDRNVYGELAFAGGDTTLYLRDKALIHASAIPDQCIKGVLHDLTNVTLVKCITTSDLCSHSRGDEKYFSASIFPHYVVLGDNHIDPKNKTINEVHFVVDDATTLFYDFDAFGTLIDARPFIEKIVLANGLEREIQIGTDPVISYFTGKREIFSAKTKLGIISATHNPTFDSGGPNGVSMQNTIFVTIVFQKTVDFEEAISHTFTLLKYFEMLVGRPQNLLKLNICIPYQDKHPSLLQVYWSLPPKRDPSNENEKPHVADVLLDAVRQTNEFSNVLSNWLDRQDSWQDARSRFSNSFANQHHYNVDRLIGAANMFDILPSSAVPPDVKLSEELECATKNSREIFKKLPNGLERNSILNALGRVGKSTLKHKIRHRGQLLVNKTDECFSEIFTVTDEAVDCRNHYVHDSAPKFDYNNNFDTVIFFTNTLEFVFAASDLIEAGWDINYWSKNHSAMSHPFGRYRASYTENLRVLKALLK